MPRRATDRLGGSRYFTIRSLWARWLVSLFGRETSRTASDIERHKLSDGAFSEAANLPSPGKLFLITFGEGLR